MRQKLFKAFTDGINDNIDPDSIKETAAAGALNWISKGDKVELIPGKLIVGNEDESIGSVSATHVAKRPNGFDLLYKVVGKKLMYLEGETWHEVGTDLIPDGADVSFANYESLAGSQVFINSPKGPYLKIMTANPGSYTNVYSPTKNYYGRIVINQARTILFGRENENSGRYDSYIDKMKYTTISNETIGTGDGSKKGFTHTLAFKAVGATRTCFALQITVGTKNIIDEYNNGILIGDGVYGSINYTTGEITLSFTTAPAAGVNLIASYQWEDSLDQGICDFTYSAVRQAGEGNIMLQPGAGELGNIGSYNSAEFCFHRSKTWKVALTADDTSGTNLIWRENVGISYWRSMVESGDGVYYIDTLNQDEPAMRLLTLAYNTMGEITRMISFMKSFKNYDFSHATMAEWGRYILCTCRVKGSEYNDRLIIYDKAFKAFTMASYCVNTLSIYNGRVVAGESNSNNVIELFKGYEDIAMLKGNFYESGEGILEYEGIKKVRRIIIEGKIALDQKIKIFLRFDNGEWGQVGEISGSGPYIDRDLEEALLGEAEIGSAMIGGDGAEIEANHYKREIRIPSGKFNKVSFRFEAEGLGYASVSMFGFWGIILKQMKSIARYRK